MDIYYYFNQKGQKKGQLPVVTHCFSSIYSVFHCFFCLHGAVIKNHCIVAGPNQSMEDNLRSKAALLFLLPSKTDSQYCTLS